MALTAAARTGRSLATGWSDVGQTSCSAFSTVTSGSSASATSPVTSGFSAPATSKGTKVARASSVVCVAGPLQ